MSFSKTRSYVASEESLGTMSQLLDADSKDWHEALEPRIAEAAQEAASQAFAEGRST